MRVLPRISRLERWKSSTVDDPLYKAEDDRSSEQINYSALFLLQVTSARSPALRCAHRARIRAFDQHDGPRGGLGADNLCHKRTCVHA